MNEVAAAARDAFEWSAFDANGNEYPRTEWLSTANIPVPIDRLVGWTVDDREGTSVEVRIPPGAEAVTMRRADTLSRGVLALIWKMDGREEWTWLFPDGTVALTDDDPMTRKWGWEDFLEDVGRTH